MRQFRMVTPDNRYMCQAAIANGYLWFELYAMSPDPSGVGMDLSLTNEAVAALPAQEVLQNYTYLMIQSGEGLNDGALTLYLDGNKLTNIALTTAPPYPYNWAVNVAASETLLPVTDVSEVQQMRLYNESATDAQVSADYANSCLGPVGQLADADQQQEWGIFNSPNFCNNNSASSTLVVVGDRGALNVTANPNPSGSLLNDFALKNVINTFTMEFWVYPQSQDIFYDGESTDIFAGTQPHPYAISPFWGGYASTGMCGVGISVGTNGVTVFEHADEDMFRPC